MAKKASGKAHRKGLSLLEIADMFRDNDDAREWIESVRWPNGPYCPKCGSFNVQANIKHKTMTHRCRDCYTGKSKTMFTVRVGSVMEGTKMPYRVWAIGIYLLSVNLKGISSMQLHRELKIGQKAAWFMLHRLRLATEETPEQFSGPVEADKTHMGGKRKNKSKAKLKELSGCGADRFYVGRRQSHRVVFKRTDSQIVIDRWANMGERTPLMALAVQLDDDGECVLIDEDQNAWKPWQVRRKALEKTLFV